MENGRGFIPSIFIPTTRTSQSIMLVSKFEKLPQLEVSSEIDTLS